MPVAGLSRRAFLGTVGAVSALWAIPAEIVGAQLARALEPGSGVTTVDQTIRLGPVQRSSYRTLVAAAGEQHQPRYDLLGRVADSGRRASRRSLAYVGHLSDIHIIDAQSPARLEPLISLSHTLFPSAFRPHDPLTVQVGASMVTSVADVRISPLTGAPMSAAFVTGDSSDMLSHLETRWYIDVLDGRTVVANSGAAGIYEGVQAWPEAAWAYHPGGPQGDLFGAYGFPQVPGMLEAAVTQTVASPGLPTPWYSVYGNHDTLYLGTFAVPDSLRSFAVGGRKYVNATALSVDYVGDWSADTTALTRAWNDLSSRLGSLGTRSVAADPHRKLLDQHAFMTEHFSTRVHPGPIGHGFTPDNIRSGRTYWSADVGPLLRVFGLDTCNQVAGPDGAVPQEQVDWLTAGLSQAERDGRLALVLSHHNSFTLENPAQLATSPQRLVHAEEFISLLLGFPSMIAWLNGHTHVNSITAHRRTDGRPVDSGRSPPRHAWNIHSSSRR